MQPFLLQSLVSHCQSFVGACRGSTPIVITRCVSFYQFPVIRSFLSAKRERERFYSRSLPRCFICFFANYIRKLPTYPHAVISSLTFEVTTTTLQPLRNSLHFSFMCLHLKHQFRSITVSFYN